MESNKAIMERMARANVLAQAYTAVVDGQRSHREWKDVTGKFNERRICETALEDSVDGHDDKWLIDRFKALVMAYRKSLILKRNTTYSK